MIKQLLNRGRAWGGGGDGVLFALFLVGCLCMCCLLTLPLGVIGRLSSAIVPVSIFYKSTAGCYRADNGPL